MPASTALKLRDGDHKSLQGRQIGPSGTSKPECRKWTEGIWSEALQGFKNEPNVILGLALLPDLKNGILKGISVSESIIAGPPNIIDSLTSSNIPQQCRNVRIQFEHWTDASVRLIPVIRLGDSSSGYKISDNSGMSSIFGAVIRFKSYAMDVRLSNYLSDEQPAKLLDQLAQEAYRKAATLP